MHATLFHCQLVAPWLLLLQPGDRLVNFVSAGLSLHYRFPLDSTCVKQVGPASQRQSKTKCIRCRLTATAGFNSRPVNTIAPRFADRS